MQGDRNDSAALFGFVFVDFCTVKGTIKDSGKWYAELAATRRLS